MSKKPNIKRLTYLVSGLLLLLAVLLLLPQSATLQEGAEIIRDADLEYVFFGILLFTGTYFAAALVLKTIALERITYNRTLLIQLASGFANKLAPAGIGGFALNTRYLTKNRHTVVQASSVTALNGLLGFGGHVVILLLSALFAWSTLSRTFRVSINPVVLLVGLIVLVLAVIIILLIKPVRVRLRKVARDTRRVIELYRASPMKILGGFVGACLVTALFTAALYFTALSLGVQLTFLEVMLVYTAGTIGTAITPTPGGVGGTEAALTAALVAVGIDTPLAVSVAVLYRIITYWMPIIPGFMLFQLALHRQYI